VFVISEAAYQINGLEGDHSQRLGNYKVGAWYDGSHLTDFETGATRHGSWGSYALFDQLLVPFGSPGSNRGLAAFGSITIAPDSTIQALPVFFTASVGARGLLDVRPTDAILVGVASGYFSSELREAQLDGRQPRTDGGAQDRETVIELAYRFHLRKGALLFQPDFQYIIQPGGTGRLNNASVLGAQFAINF
jgi:porin